MFTETKHYKDGLALDHTPAAALTAGQMLQVAGMAAIAITDIAASILGAVQITGLIKAAAAAVVGNAGDVVWWDEDGDPVGGTAGSGAATTIAANGDFAIGSLGAALAAADGEAITRLNEYAPDRPSWPNRVHETVSDDLTLDAEDSGKVLHVDTDAKTITLPATATAVDVIIVNDGADAGVAVNIDPDANDRIFGQNIAGDENKDLINTKTTAIRGDFVHIVGGDAVGYRILEKRGIWATESA